MKKLLLIAFIVVPCVTFAQVTIRDSVITWHTFKFTLNDDNTVNYHSDTPYDTIARTFNTYIIENEYIKATLLPEYGGRILSLIYKPTGREQLYQNPAGAPYGVGEDWFYYKWLMVYGGIFPTLTEPEHGKAWQLPWSFEILKQTPDTIRCLMSWTDTVDIDGINKGIWKYGRTNLKCNFIVTLAIGSSALETDVEIINDSNEGKDYEYWTCLTLAPGSEPGKPECTDGAEILVKADKVKIPSWYPEMMRQEKAVPGQRNIFTFTKLRQWKNWTSDGIAYAWDNNIENYWGVIDHNNEQGFIRLSDNIITKGVKIWAWGYQQSQDIDPFNDPTEVHRPYVELWAGHSREFFESAHIEANSVKKWKENYVPTVGLSGVSAAGTQFISDMNVEDNKVNFSFVSTKPQNLNDIKVEITGSSPEELLSQNVLADPVNGNRYSINLPLNKTWIAGDSVVCSISDNETGQSLSASLSLYTTVTGINEHLTSTVKEFQLYQNYPNPFNPSTLISFSLEREDKVLLEIFNITGEKVSQLVNGNLPAGIHNVNFDASDLPGGIYIYRITTSGNTAARKMALIK